MYELNRGDYPKVIDLFKSLAEFNVALPAGMDGNNFCQIYVNNPEKPTGALAHTVEGSLLSGEPDSSFIQALRNHLQQVFFAKGTVGREQRFPPHPALDAYADASLPLSQP